MRKTSTGLLEQGTQTPSPAPDLIPAETRTENSHRDWYSKRGHFIRPFTDAEHLWPSVFSRLEQGKFATDLGQLSEKEIAFLRAVATNDEDEFNPAPFVQKFHPQYLKRLGDKGLLIRAGRGRYKFYHPLFRQFLKQQP